MENARLVVGLVSAVIALVTAVIGFSAKGKGPEARQGPQVIEQSAAEHKFHVIYNEAPAAPPPAPRRSRAPWFVVAFLLLVVAALLIVPSGSGDHGPGRSPVAGEGSEAPPPAPTTPAGGETAGSTEASPGGPTTATEEQLQEFLNSYYRAVEDARPGGDEAVLYDYIDFPVTWFESKRPAPSGRIAAAIWPARERTRIFGRPSLVGVCYDHGDDLEIEAVIRYHDVGESESHPDDVRYKLVRSRVGQPFRFTEFKENKPCE